MTTITVEIDREQLQTFLEEAQRGKAEHSALMTNLHEAIGYLVRFGVGYARGVVRLQSEGELLGVYYTDDTSERPAFVLGGIYRGPLIEPSGAIHNEGAKPEWTFHS